MKNLPGIFVLFLLVTSCSTQKEVLSLNLDEGESYTQKQISEAKVVQEYGGMQMEMLMTIEGEMTYKVLSKNQDNYDLDVMYDRMKLALEMQQGRIEFNSVNPAEGDIFSTILSRMTGQAFHVKMSITGKVLEIQGIEEVMTRVFEDLVPVETSQVDQMKDQILRAYGREAFKGSLEMLTAIYSDDPVSKGDSWTVNTKLESGMSALLTTLFELKEVNKEHAFIEGIGTIVTADKDAYIENNGIPMKYDLKGNMYSRLTVDKKTGWIVEATIQQDISGDAYLKDSPQIPGGLKVPMEMTTEIKVTN